MNTLLPIMLQLPLFLTHCMNFKSNKELSTSVRKCEQYLYEIIHSLFLAHAQYTIKLPLLLYLTKLRKDRINEGNRRNK